MFEALGPGPLGAYDGYKYFVTFIDENSHAKWIYLSKFKSKVILVFALFYNLILHKFAAKIKIIRSNNGTEFLKNSYSKF